MLLDGSAPVSAAGADSSGCVGTGCSRSLREAFYFFFSPSKAHCCPNTVVVTLDPSRTARTRGRDEATPTNSGGSRTTAREGERNNEGRIAGPLSRTSWQSPTKIHETEEEADLQWYCLFICFSICLVEHLVSSVAFVFCSCDVPALSPFCGWCPGCVASVPIFCCCYCCCCCCVFDCEPDRTLSHQTHGAESRVCFFLFAVNSRWFASEHDFFPPSVHLSVSHQLMLQCVFLIHTAFTVRRVYFSFFSVSRCCANRHTCTRLQAIGRARARKVCMAWTLM